MSLSEVIIYIVMGAGTLVVTGLLAYIGISLWWMFFDKTKTAKMVLEFIKDNYGVLIEWYEEKHPQEKVPLGLRLVNWLWR